MLTKKGLENISKESAEFVYKFTLNAHNLLEKEDIENLTHIIIEKGNPAYIYAFARDINPFDVELFTSALINLRAYSYFALFANTVDGVDIYRLSKEIKKCDDPQIIMEFSEFVIEKRQRELKNIANCLEKKVKHISGRKK